MHTICSPHGNVFRIVIFKKNGVQAMVEFDSIDSARRAKQALQGADIYSGCCTLKIEYAKVWRFLRKHYTGSCYNEFGYKENPTIMNTLLSFKIIYCIVNKFTYNEHAFMTNIVSFASFYWW